MEKEQLCIICDLDGTLASCLWRLHFVDDENDWESFFKGLRFDAVIPDTLNLLKEKESQGREIIYVTARPEKYRRWTEEWLRNHSCPDGVIIMRRDKDTRHASKVKEDELQHLIRGGKKIELALDDNKHIIDMYERNGIPNKMVKDPDIKPHILEQDDRFSGNLPTARVLLQIAKLLIE